MKSQRKIPKFSATQGNKNELVASIVGGKMFVSSRGVTKMDNFFCCFCRFC